MMASLNSFLSLLVWDLKIQLRYYFWVTALVVTGVWLALLLALTEEAAIFWLPILIFAEISMIGLLFIAGILFLERRQGTIFVAAVLPVSAAVWLAIKLISLSLLCTACGALLVLLNVGQVNWLRMLPAIFLNSALFTSFGFLLACPFNKLLNYFMAMALALAVMNLPILTHLGIFEHPLMWLLPSQPALWLLANSFLESPGVIFYAVSVLLMSWLAVFYYLGIKLFVRTNSLS